MLTALVGLTALSGVTEDKFYGNGQGVSAANFYRPPKSTHMAHRGSGVHNPHLLPTLFSFAALFGLTVADNFQGGNQTCGSAANFFLTQECQYKKRGCYRPWRP